jgi:hypothetical protein
MLNEKLKTESVESGSVGTKKGRRPRCDAAVRQLPPEQRAKVDAWLFDELLPYEEVIRRAQSELDAKLTRSGLSRYARQELAGRIRTKPSGAAGYVALLETINHAVLRAAQRLELESDPKALAQFARVLVAARNEASHSLRACTTRQKFEFDAATACLVHQVKMQSIAGDESLDDTQRILKIREELFGPDLPK